MRKSAWLKTGLSQEAGKVSGLKRLLKRCGSGFAEICSGNRRSCPESWTYQPNQFWASSATINTWECIVPQRDTSLLLLWRQSNGQEQSFSSRGTPRTGMKTSSSQMRKSSPLRSSTTTRTTRLTLSWRTTYIYVVPHRYPPDVAFYIFIQQIYVQNILNMLHTLRFFLFKMPFIS